MSKPISRDDAIELAKSTGELLAEIDDGEQIHEEICKYLLGLIDFIDGTRGPDQNAQKEPLDKMIKMLASIKKQVDDEEIGESLKLLQEYRKLLDVENVTAKVAETVEKRVQFNNLDTESTKVRVGGAIVMTGGAVTAIKTKEIKMLLNEADKKMDKNVDTSSLENIRTKDTEKVIKEYKLDEILNLQQSLLGDTMGKLNEYIATQSVGTSFEKGSPVKIPRGNIKSMLAKVNEQIQFVYKLDKEKVTNAMKTETESLTGREYRTTAVNDLPIQLDEIIEAKHELKQRHAVKKNIKNLIQSAIEATSLRDIPDPPNIDPVDTLDYSSLEAYFASIHKYIDEEYKSIPWLNTIEEHLNNLADLIARLIDAIEFLISDENKVTCIKKIEKLFRTILRAQILRKSEKIQLSQKHSIFVDKFPALINKGRLTDVEILSKYF